MSEHTPYHHEHLPARHEVPESVERQAEKPAAHETKPETNQSIETIRHQAETAAVSSEETSIDQPNDDAVSPLGLHQTQKNSAFYHYLTVARSKLSKPERTFSKVIHQRQINQLSELGGKTVARPAGLLGGGSVVLIGSLVLLYTSKHYGFYYNYSAFLILLIIGFVIGVTIEFIVRELTRNK